MRRKPQLELVKTHLPHWLLPKRSPNSPVTEADLEYIFDEMIKGHTLSSILKDHGGMPDYAVIMKFVFADPKLENRYYEAKRMQTEAYIDTMTEKALGMEDADVPEEVESRKVAIGHLRWLVGVNNRKRYGDSKSITINGQLDIGTAMAKADERLEQGVTIEHED